MMRAIKAKRGTRAAREFFQLVSAACAHDQIAVKAAMTHRLWSKHCIRLAEMRRSGELDLIHRDRAYAGNFFRDYELRRYEEWRDEQRFILQAMDEPIPAWLRSPAIDIAPRRVLDRV
jgi:hypothetical protein